jgi:hypothetical protein
MTIFERWIRTGVAVGISDAIFASSLALLVPPYATLLRLWQGVASVPFGNGMIGGGGHIPFVAMPMVLVNRRRLATADQ